MREIQPDEIARIRTQSAEERWDALIQRAKNSSKNGRHEIAAREATLALDLAKHPLPFLIRAISNLRLERLADAEADASACLELQRDCVSAISVRAFACLGLGELQLAKDDADLLIELNPDDRDGLLVRAEVNFQLDRWDAALVDAERMLANDSSDEDARQLRDDILTQLAGGTKERGGLPQI